MKPLKETLLECESIGTEIMSCPICHKTAELIMSAQGPYIACEKGHSQNKPE